VWKKLILLMYISEPRIGGIWGFRARIAHHRPTRQTGKLGAEEHVEMPDVRAPPTENETGEVQARAYSDCALNHGLYQGYVVLDDPDFPYCDNCKWNKRRCYSAPSPRPSGSHYSLPAKSPTKSGGSFTTTNSTFGNHQGKAADAEAADIGDGG